MNMLRVMFLTACLISPIAHASSAAQPTFNPTVDADTESEEEVQARTIYERFLKQLLREPKPGTALDRVFTFHLERGSLSQFANSLQAAVLGDNDSDTSASWLLLGLIEQRRGDHLAAVAWLSQAEQERTMDFQATWQLGRSLAALGRFPEAAQALERAIERSSNKAELLPVYQELHRAFRRCRQPEKAREVLTRMEQLFAYDLRVKEQIAIGLNDDGDFEAALQRYSQLATLHRDPHQATQFSFAAAQLKARLRRTDEAIQDLEQQMETLDPESWLYREARRRIEDILRQSSDPLALVTYYERWIAIHPDDVDGMIRLAKALASNGRAPESLPWYTKALDRAPSSVKLHQAYIDQLISEEKYQQAIAQYERLYSYQSDNADILEAWGQLYLQLPDLPQNARRSKAAEVWQLMLKDSPEDVVKVAHVAALMHRAGLNEESLLLYQRAMELAPDDPQHRAAAGDLLWALNRQDEANVVWTSIADGSRRSTENLIRLSEVLERSGQHEKSLAAMIEACSLTPELTDRIGLARRLRETSVAKALEQLSLADSMTESEEERALVFEERLACLKAGNLLDKAIADLSVELQIDVADPAANIKVPLSEEPVPQLLMLAMYAEADQQYSVATKAIEKAAELEPEAARIWTVAAQLYETTGRSADAISAHRRLIALDRRTVNESLKKIAELEQRLGHLAAAQLAGRELVAANPDNMDHLQFYAELCFELGKKEEGLTSLRRMVRASSSDGSTLLKLGHELANHGDPAEAIEIYWRAIDVTTDIETQTTVASSLAALHLKIHQFDRLIQRLEERARDLGKRRGAILALATAFQTAGDLVSARAHLESIVDAEPQEEFLLTLLSRICEEEGDLQAAGDYVRRMEETWPSQSNRLRLTSLLVKSGVLREADSLWQQLQQSPVRPHELIHLIDQALVAQNLESARAMSRQVVQSDAKNWEAIARLVIVERVDGNVEESVRMARELTELNLASDAPSAAETWNRQQPTFKFSPGDSLPNPIVARWERTGQWIDVLQPEGDDSSVLLKETLQKVSELSSNGLPRDFGEARILCRCVVWVHAKRLNRESEFFDELKAGLQDGHESASDFVMFQALRNKQSPDAATRRNMMEAARELAQSQTASLQALYLYIARLCMEEDWTNPPSIHFGEVTELQLMELIRSYEAVLASHPEWTVPESSYSLLSGQPDPQVIVKAARATGQMQQAETLCERLLSENSSAQQVYAGLWLSLEMERSSVEDTLTQLERVIALSNHAHQPNKLSLSASNFISVVQALALKAQEREEEQSLVKILDWWLKHQQNISGTGSPVEMRSAVSMASQIQIEANALSGKLIQSATPDAFARGRIQSTMSAANALRIDHVMSRSEIAFWETLVRHAVVQKSTSSLNEWARTRLESAGNEQKLTLQLALAAMAWELESQQDVTPHMDAAAAFRPTDMRLKLSLAELYEEQGRYEDALETLDDAIGPDSSLVKAREIAALAFSAKVRNEQRAQLAGQRLVGLQLTLQESRFVAKCLQEMTLMELAAEINSRSEVHLVTATPASSVATCPSAVMETYVQQGNTSAAVQIAVQLIRRTQGGGTPWRNTQHGTPAQIRERAFKILKQSGELDQMITREKAQLEKSPHSRILMQKLIEYLTAAGRDEEVAEIREQMISGMKGNSTDALRELAQQQRLAGKTSKACDTWLRIIESDPVAFWDHAPIVEALMADAGRLSDLTKAILQSEKVPPQKYVGTSVLHPLLSRLTNDVTLSPDAAILMEFIVQQHPEDIVDAISSIQNKTTWQSPEMFRILISIYAPETAPQIAAGRYIWPQNYESNSARHGDKPVVSLQLLNSLLDSDVRRTQLQQASLNSEKANPECPTHVLLRLILASRKENAHAEVQQLVSAITTDPDKCLPEPVAYELAVLMATGDASIKRQAITLLEASLNDVRVSQMHLGSPALVLITDLYVETQQENSGREFLVSMEPLRAVSGNKQETEDEDEKVRFIGVRLASSAALSKLGESIAAWNLLNDITEADCAWYLESVRPLGYTFMNRAWVKSHSADALRAEIASRITPGVLADRLNSLASEQANVELSDSRLFLSCEMQDVENDQDSLRVLKCPLLEAVKDGSAASYSPSVMQELSDAVVKSLMTSNGNRSTTILGLSVMLEHGNGRFGPPVAAELDAFLVKPLTDVKKSADAVSGSDLLKRQYELHSEIGFACVAAALAPEKDNVKLAERMFDRATSAARALANAFPEDRSYESSIWTLRAGFLSAASDPEAAAIARKQAMETREK